LLRHFAFWSLEHIGRLSHSYSKTRHNSVF